jgi:chromosome segregation protein
MYLKEIKLENFKSMKGNVSIQFKEGFTAVTGPNGSGKSNISDAILFVLGPKSSKAIRAGNLLELIWNGGKEGKPADKCKVTLVFDNKDRTMPVGYDEVNLTRVIKRSKESKQGYSSYFYINGNKSTLKEFEELLAYAGISADGYNMVQQGDVTKIVSMGGVERRRIIEGIAGITHLNEEMEKARNKRIEVEDNLEKIAIRMEEIESRLKDLDSDRSAALRYRELQERMKLAEAQLAYKKLISMQSERETLKKNIDDFENERRNLESNLEELKKKLEDIENELKKTEDEVANRWGDEAKKVKEQIDSYRLQLAKIESFMESSEERIKELTRNMEAHKKSLSEDEKNLSELTGKRDAETKKLNEIKQERDKVRSELNSLKEKHSNSSKRGAELSRRYSELSEKRSKMMSELSEIKERKATLQERLNGLKERKASLEEEKKDVEFNLQDAKWQLSNLKKGARYSTKDIRKMKEELFRLRVEEREKSEELNRLNSEINRINEKYAVEKAKMDARSGGMSAVNSILEARDRGILKGIIGTVGEIISYDSKYSKAMEIAAGNRINAIIVESDDAAAKAIRYLKDNKIGRATFLPLNKMRMGRPSGRALLASKKEGVIGFAIDIAEYDERYRAALWYVFGDTLIVRNLDTARKLMGGVRLVTLDGELIEASGAMVGGTIRKVSTGRNREIEELGRMLREKKALADKVSNELTSIRIRIEDLDEKVREADKDSELSAKIEALEMKEKEYRSKLDEIKSSIKGVSVEISKIENELKDVSAKVESMQNELTKIGEELLSIEEERKSLMPEDMQNRISELESRYSELDEKIKGMEIELKGLEAEISSTERSISEHKSRISEMEEEINRKKAEMKEKEKQSFEIKSKLEAIVNVNKGIEEEMRALREKRELLISEQSKIRAEIEGTRTMLETKQDYIMGLKAKVQTIDESIVETEEKYRSYGIEVKEPVPSMEKLKKTIRECELEISGIGYVNFRAIDDYDEQSQRYNELKEQTDRLKEQKKELIELEKEIEEKKKEAFFRTFASVNENFKKIYAELSGGGEGELRLDNPESPFDGGMQIIARPRGKKVYRIEALSGGEKSLVALAFIFAIQEYDPSTFYLLDEVDQNLDGLNSELVGQRIRRSSKRAQFIVISLRKATLKYADHLIGVTMVGDGVSRILQKMNIDELPDEEENEENAEMEVAEASA